MSFTTLRFFVGKAKGLKESGRLGKGLFSEIICNKQN